MSADRGDLAAALDLFNHAQFFEAHEALEDLWRAAADSSPAKKHLQGLVQLAVAFHHESQGNFRGARSVFERALGNLRDAEQSFPALDFENLRDELSSWQTYLRDRKLRPSPLRIHRRNHGG